MGSPAWGPFATKLGDMWAGAKAEQAASEGAWADYTRQIRETGKWGPMTDAMLMGSPAFALGTGGGGVKAAGGVAGAAERGLAAYHASPHDFNAFDLSKMGTGEGNQSFGHGAYLAESPKVSGRGGYYDQMFSRPGKPAKIYETQIKATPEQMLDWDASAADQPAVRKLIESHPDILDEAIGNHFGMWPDNLAAMAPERAAVFRQRVPGSAIYEAAVGKFGSPAAASEALNKAGVPGIRFLDELSRGGAGNTSNYVVFNDKLIDILKKYGLAGLGLFGAGGLGSAGMPQGGQQ